MPIQRVVINAAGQVVDVNPRTGRPWSLADAETQRELKAEMAAMKRNPELAKAFLRELGILTPGGKLSKRYGG